MRGQTTTCMTSPRSADVMNGTDKELETSSEKDVDQNSVTTVEITPMKAPSEMKSAIRRQKRTGNLDYLWQALPVTRNARPLYRAVLRGSLQPGNVQYTIANVNDPEHKTSVVTTSDEVVTSSTNSKTYSHYAHNLSIAGLSINDIKFQEPSGNVSPRARFGQTAQYASRHMRPNFLDQKNNDNNNNYVNVFVNRRVDCIENVDVGRVAFLRNSQIVSPANHFNGISPKLLNGNIEKSQSFLRVSDDDTNKLQSVSFSQVFVKTDNAVEPHKKLAFQNGTKHASHNEGVSPNLTPKSYFKKTFVANSQQTREGRDKNINESKQVTGSSIPKQTDSAKATAAIQNSPQPPSDNLIHSRENTVPGLSCIQLADSILGAVNGDLSHVYSLCQSKMRYSEFIERSHPHRLENKTPEDIVVSRTADHLQHPLERAATSLENSRLHLTKSNTTDLMTSSSTSSNETTRLPVIKASKRSKCHLRTLNTFFNTNRYMRIRAPEANTEKIVRTNDVATPNLGKAGRPILKTFKSDDESSVNAKNMPSIKEMSSNFADTSHVNNRLVRFNTSHEVREFTPSEPIRQQ